MKLPRGNLVRERVVESVGTVLSTALGSGLTGYARLESQDALLLDADGAGILTFEDGVPVVAYHTGTDSTGGDALADIALAGPFRIELYELDAEELAHVHDSDPLRVAPDRPAEHLASDPDLAERTRAAAPAERTVAGEEIPDEDGAVESFLDDEEKIESIQERAREQAQQRADEWGLKR